MLLEEEKYMVQKSAIIKKKVKDENGQTSEVSSVCLAVGNANVQ